MIAISRALRPFAFSALSVALLLGIGNPVAGQHAAPSARDNQARVVKIERPTTREPAWLYKGSDITPDPAWYFGTLPNGLRYAVRRNGVPPGQVAVRVRIDAGSLFETDSERGFAHLIEHLSFRGSVHVPDGEAKRVWQRLGTTFGSDTNAQTTPTGTTYKLDLPGATTQGLDDSLKILAGMMSQPNITQQALNAERPVVLAEQREQPGPQVRYRDRLSAVFFAGQALADRSPIGTIKALEAASAPEVKAFHDRWYRPERAVVIISGDLDPALFEQLIEKNFSDWKGIGPNPADPDFGKPDPLRPITGSIVEPSLPPSVSFSVLRPWVYRDDTVIFNQRRLVDLVALRLINRRLETRARTGGSFLQATVELNDISRSVNATFVNVLPAGEDWEAALRDVRATIADAQATPPSQSEIDRELSEFDIAMKTEVDTAPAEGGAKEADDLDQAVDIRETVTTAAVAYDILQDAKAKGMFSADALLAATRRLFMGDVTRAFINTRSVDPAIDSRLALALKADVSGLAAKRKALVKADFSSLPKLGKPGKIIKRTPLPDVNAVQVDFANGARALLFPTAGEASRVYVRVRFGRGYNALPARRQSAAWAAALALVPSGIGKLGQEAIDQLTTGRRIGLSFDIDDDAFVFGYTTSPEDLADQMKLIAAKLAAPGWDPNPLARAKAVSLAAYPGLSSSPSGVLARDLNGLLHDGDPRWLTPTEKQIAATTPAQFRALWEPLLKSGPIEVQLFGNFELEEGVSVVANSIGALPPRREITAPAPPVRFPAHVTQPVLRTHDGPQNQAVAVIAWPTGGGVEGIAQSRRLELIAQIFSDRLFDRLRSEAGASYSPSVQSSWPEGLADGGRMVAVAQVPPDKVDFFFALAREIAADLAANPVGDDELRRTLLPYFQSIQRSATGNSFWLGLLAGATRDPQVVEQAAGLAKDLGTIDARQLQQVAAKYLQPARDWSMVVLPAKGAGVAAGATGPGVPPGR
ncbi:MAG: insulinase family protein [Sphingomonas sp.]|jgi:zinc protease